MAASSRAKNVGQFLTTIAEHDELIYEGDDDSDSYEGPYGAAFDSPMEINTDSEPENGYAVHVLELQAELSAAREGVAERQERDLELMKIQARRSVPVTSFYEAAGIEKACASIQEFQNVSNLRIVLNKILMVLHGLSCLLA